MVVIGGILWWTAFNSRSTSVNSDFYSLATMPTESDREISEARAQNARSGIGYEIYSVEYLKKISRSHFTYDRMRVTYYVLAKSIRAVVDSLPECLQEHVRKNGIDTNDFQFTYFLDLVLTAGSGVLRWEGQDYFVRYDLLRAHGWPANEGRRRNDYRCSSFSFRNKKATEFIRANIANKALFTPLSEAPYPNGRAASGEAVVDWQTLAVNPVDLPLSVPNAKRRETLTRRFRASGRRPPQPRVFVVLEFPNGRKFLTEASDTGSGVKANTVDWRIGNTSAEIDFFHALGESAKATGYLVEDEKMSFEQVWVQSKR